MSKREGAALYAVYDLQVAAPDFDSHNFLVLAEWTRRQRKLGQIKIIVVPEENHRWDGARQFGNKKLDWRFDNLLLPSFRFLRSCKSIFICANRDEAQKLLDNTENEIFPERYSTTHPFILNTPDWTILLANMGEELDYFRASERAVELIDAWKCTLENPKIVTITLRQSPHQVQRNSNLDSWSKFAHILSDNGYFPVVLPDTEVSLLALTGGFEGITSMPAASINLDIRMALYEVSYLNLFVSNGPAVLGFFNSKIRFLQFMSGELLSDTSAMEQFHGVKYGSNPANLNKFQRLVWREDHVDVLWDEFSRISEDIDTALEEGTYHDRLRPDPESQEDMIVFAERIAKYGNWDLLRTLARWMIKNERRRFTNHFFAGLAEEKLSINSSRSNLTLMKEQFNLAVQYFDDRDHRDFKANTIGRYIYCCSKLGILPESGELEDFIRRGQKGKLDNEVFSELGKTLISLSEHSALKGLLRSINQKDLLRPNTINSYANFLYDLTEYSSATSIYEIMRENGILSGDTINRYGIALEFTHRREDAWRLYHSYFKLGELNIAALFRFAGLSKELDRLNYALKIFEWFFDNGGRSSVLLTSLSQIHSRLGHFRLAEEFRYQAGEARGAEQQNEVSFIDHEIKEENALKFLHNIAEG